MKSLITAGFVSMILILSAQFALAAMEVIAGRVAKRSDYTFTIEQRNGQSRDVRLNHKVPVVAVPNVSATPLDRIKNDTKVSIIMKDGKPVVLQIVEVPK